MESLIIQDNISDKISGIYCIENMIDGMKYIGCGKDVALRWKRHYLALENGTHSNIHLKNAYKKYGSNNFSYYMIQSLPCQENILKDMESYWICYYNTFYQDGGGYNLTRGGDGCWGRNPSLETLKKMSDALRGEKSPFYGKPCPDLIKEKISNAQMGEKNPFFGRKHSQKTLEKIIVSSQGRKRENSTSRFVGVSWKAQRNKWRASIVINKKFLDIGLFDYEEEAALAYNEIALESYGFNAKTNHISEQEIKALWKGAG